MKTDPFHVEPVNSERNSLPVRFISGVKGALRISQFLLLCALLFQTVAIQAQEQPEAGTADLDISGYGILGNFELKRLLSRCWP